MVELIDGIDAICVALDARVLCRVVMFCSSIIFALFNAVIADVLLAMFDSSMICAVLIDVIAASSSTCNAAVELVSVCNDLIDASSMIVDCCNEAIESAADVDALLNVEIDAVFAVMTDCIDVIVESDAAIALLSADSSPCKVLKAVATAFPILVFVAVFDG